MNSLVLKLPPKKPPFIGIMMFNLGVVPPDLNTDLILDPRYNGAVYQLYIEFEGYNLRIKLINLEHLIIRDYLNITAENKELRNWLDKTRFCHRFNFGHVVKVNHEDAIVKTYQNKKPVVFPVNEIRLLNAVP